MIHQILSHALSGLAISSLSSIWVVLALIFLCVIFGSHTTLRWPLLLIAGAHIILEMTLIVVALVALGLWDLIVRRTRPSNRVSQLLAKMDSASSWLAFHAAASDLDAYSSDITAWKHKAEDSRGECR